MSTKVSKKIQVISRKWLRK